mmetsp:Transcript_27858/g.46814  ORF Transcript_27858/g.46814 Transcript_27858/m.46814 type:complete len:120 (-) Transcript_27858:95-454(-)
MSQAQNISTHVLDTAKGAPAGGIEVKLFPAIESKDKSDYIWGSSIAETTTNGDGRGLFVFDIVPGVYKATFLVGPYFERTGTPTFYPKIDIVFRVADPSSHYHVPLILGPFGYSTYRGS